MTEKRYRMIKGEKEQGREREREREREDETERVVLQRVCSRPLPWGKVYALVCCFPAAHVGLPYPQLIVNHTAPYWRALSIH